MLISDDTAQDWNNMNDCSEAKLGSDHDLDCTLNVCPAHYGDTVLMSAAAG